MNFHFTDDHRTFQESVRKMLEKECSAEHVRALWDSDTGRSTERWAKLAELGVLGLLVPEAHGGLGMSELDLVLLLEECGRVALPEPVLENMVGARLLEEIGGPLANDLLPRIAAGSEIVSVGHSINPFVTDAHIADLLLLENGNEVHAVPPAQATLTRQACNDPSRRLFRVDWQPAKKTLIASGDRARTGLAAALDRAAFACAAQQLGVAQQMLDLAVRYATERQQFGKPIGSFQAVKHMLANVAVRIEFARPVVYRAAFSLATDAATRSINASHAKVMASDAATLAAKTAIQAHGAMGYTWECDLHIWMKRAWALDLAWGTNAWHRERIARALLDGDGTIASFGYSNA